MSNKDTTTEHYEFDSSPAIDWQWWLGRGLGIICLAVVFFVGWRIIAGSPLLQSGNATAQPSQAVEVGQGVYYIDDVQITTRMYYFDDGTELSEDQIFICMVEWTVRIIYASLQGRQTQPAYDPETCKRFEGDLAKAYAELYNAGELYSAPPGD